MTDVLVQMQPLGWRGIRLPITGRDVSFSQDDVQHKFVYRDDMLIESTGARNFTFRYQVPMREDIAKGPYRNLFVSTLPQLIIACRDRSPGELDDPVLGIFRAKCTSYSDSLDVNKRDGLDVSLEFVHAPDPNVIDLLPEEVLGVESLASQAGALDESLAAVDWQQLPPPEPVSDLFADIAAFGGSLDRFGDKLSGRLDSVSFQLEKIENSVTKLEQPENWPIIRAARRLRGAVLTIHGRITDPGKTITTFTTSASKTIAALSGELGITVADLLLHNPKLAKTPAVPIGTLITFPLPSADNT